MRGNCCHLVLLLACVLGCAQGGAGIPRRDAGGGAGFDAGGLDASSPDAGARDAGPDAARDAATRDAGFDAGIGPCDESPCRLVAPQCGCPAGEGCYLEPDGARACSEAGSTAAGVLCASATACVPGHACVGAGGVTWCQRLCEDDSDCTGGAGSLCILTLGDGMGGTIPGVTMCTVHCDPVDGVECVAGTSCGVYREEMGGTRFLTHCRANGPGGEGAACTSDTGCMPRLACVGPSGGSTVCRRWCRVASGTGCTGGTTCQSLATPAIVGGVEYGICS